MPTDRIRPAKSAPDIISTDATILKIILADLVMAHIINNSYEKTSAGENKTYKTYQTNRTEK